MPILVLPLELASKIAAGEVVERPAAVAKELIENAVDAGATRIDVEARGGGVASLRVADNGSGIPADQAATAFQRYATSKVATLEDLERIGTLGFRGEALPSIAAVSEVEMLTRCLEDLGGTHLRVDEGRVVEQAQRAAPVGTSVSVRHLFRNVPARLKFLKSNNAEVGRITSVVTQYSLAYPGIRFSLTVDGKGVFASAGDGDVRQAAARVFGIDAGAAMLPVDWAGETGGGSIAMTGLVTPPGITRSNRSYFHLFVNGRLVQNRRLSFAILEGYQGLLRVGRFPIVVLNLEIDPAETDVNVHPTKVEVKFRDEGLAFSAIHKAVKQALTGAAVVRDAAWSANTPAAEAVTAPMPRTSVRPEAAPPSAMAARPAMQYHGQEQGRLRGVPILRPLGQVGRTYIVSEGPDGMYLIDQHAAHERVLFDRLKKTKAGGLPLSQGLLEPVAVELTPLQTSLLENQQSFFEGYGYVMEAFGGPAVLLRAVPQSLAAQPAAQALRDLLDGLDAEGLKDQRWEDRVLASLACHSAVRAGQDLAPKEMDEIVRLLEETDNPRTCPHGRPTMLHMSSFQLEKEFGRR